MKLVPPTASRLDVGRQICVMSNYWIELFLRLGHRLADRLRDIINGRLLA
jgi:hypothetical protein